MFAIRIIKKQKNDKNQNIYLDPLFTGTYL